MIDVGPLREDFESAAAARTIDEVRRACSEWGFFQCRNHGIDEETIAAFDLCRLLSCHLRQRHQAHGAG